jgi:hypothetical protein
VLLVVLSNGRHAQPARAARQAEQPGRVDARLLTQPAHGPPVAGSADVLAPDRAELGRDLLGISGRALAQHDLPGRRAHDRVGQVAVDGRQPGDAPVGHDQAEAGIARRAEQVGQVPALVLQQPRLVDDEQTPPLPACLA